jgi:hypothetical protein
MLKIRFHLPARCGLPFYGMVYGDPSKDQAHTWVGPKFRKIHHLPKRQIETTPLLSSSIIFGCSSGMNVIFGNMEKKVYHFWAFNTTFRVWQKETVEARVSTIYTVRNQCTSSL